MSIQRLVISALAIIVSCHASGIGHLSPVLKSFPIVRYDPFFNFPNTGRSIHAVAPLPAPVFPAPVPAPAPAPLYPAPVPGPAFPSPLFSGPGFPNLQFYASAPAPLPAPIPAPVPFAPQLFLPKLAPLVPTLPKIPTLIPYLRKLAPIAPALAPAPLYARAVQALPATPFSPIFRPVQAHAFPAPVFAPAPAPAPLSFPPYAPHLHYASSPFIKQGAWK